MASYRLRNRRHELFAQMIVAGCPRPEAYQKAGFKGKNSASASQLYNRPDVRKRIEELFTASANRAELSRKQILDRIYEDWDNSRRLGQMASALKAAELMGKELHKMFVERKEVGGPGDFDSKSEDELRQIVEDGIKELGWDKPTLN